MRKEIGYLSDAADIVEAINHSLSIETDLVFDHIGTSMTSSGPDLIGKLGGRDVRIEVRHQPAGGAYSETVWVYDKATGKTLGRGNGDRRLSDAIAIYQWRSIPSDIDSL